MCAALLPKQPFIKETLLGYHQVSNFDWTKNHWEKSFLVIMIR